MWALNKQQMYNGEPSPQVVDFAGDTSDFTVIPANSRLQTGAPPVGSPAYFVSTEQFLNALSIYKFHVDWDKISTSTFTGPQTQLAPNCWPNATPANASTTANSADVLAIRAMAQAQYSNLGGAESLWVDHTVQRNVSATNSNCNATTGGNASVRWYQANVTGGTVAANVVQGQTFDPEAANTFFRFMPALAVDRNGDLAVTYTKSNSTTNPQIKYAGRLAGDPVNTLAQTEQTLIDGTGSQSGNCGALGVHPLGRLLRHGARPERLPVLDVRRVLRDHRAEPPDPHRLVPLPGLHHGRQRHALGHGHRRRQPDLGGDRRAR